MGSLNELTPEQYVNVIIDLARQVELGDPIDWGMLNVDEQQAYRLIALNVVDNLLPKYNEPDIREIMIATIVKLVVENFTLNLRLREG